MFPQCSILNVSLSPNLAQVIEYITISFKHIQRSLERAFFIICSSFVVLYLLYPILYGPVHVISAFLGMILRSRLQNLCYHAIESGKEGCCFLPAIQYKKLVQDISFAFARIYAFGNTL